MSIERTYLFMHPNSRIDQYVHDKAVCVLLHGLFGMSSNLLSVANMIEGTCIPLLFDIPNHGKSPHVVPGDFLHGVTILRDSIVHYLGEDHVPIHICGHSLGGKLAMIYALMFPDAVASLVVMDIAPITYPPSFHLTNIEALTSIQKQKPTNRKAVMDIFDSYDIESGIAAFLTKNVIFENGVGILQLNIDEIASQYDRLMSFPKELVEGKLYHGPTLFIKAENTEYFPDKYADAIERYFPRWELEEIQKAGHVIHVDNPIMLQDTLQSFYHQVIHP